MRLPRRHQRSTKFSGFPKTPAAPPFWDQYYKARKNLALFSGLLFAWEFIGLDIKAKPIANLEVTIKSPQAIPYVLIILIFYFGYRFWVEWQHADSDRRKTRASKIDFRVTLAIPLLALATFTGQRLLDIRLAERIGALTASVMLNAALFSFILRRPFDLYWIALALLAFAFSVTVTLVAPEPPKAVLTIAIFTIVIYVPIQSYLIWMRKKRHLNPRTPKT